MHLDMLLSAESFQLHPPSFTITLTASLLPRTGPVRPRASVGLSGASGLNEELNEVKP